MVTGSHSWTPSRKTSRTGKQLTLLERELTVMEVRLRFDALADTVGAGSKEKKERLIKALLSASSPLETKFLVRIFIHEMRTGFYEGLMEQAVSQAFQIPLEIVQKAVMVIGDVGEAAAIAKEQGEEGLAKARFRVFRPIRLMMAQTAADVSEALNVHSGKAAFEYKLDGARVQIHIRGNEVKIFSRRLTDVTVSLPEVTDIIQKNVEAENAILEGEVIAVDSQGNPVPFQYLMRRLKRVHAVGKMVEEVPVRLYLFDVLYLNGESLISTPYDLRRKILSDNIGQILQTDQLVTDNVEEAERFLEAAMDAGHEGLVAKEINSEYTPGIRGKHWLKVKPVLDPLDLVIVAAEYGYGRRHEWLSDYHLAARDVEEGEYLIVGKTFKGLTDEEIIKMTGKLKKLIITEVGRKVTVVPKIVVEVLYNEIQKSPKYKSEMALRFARISRIREDKTPEEADTIQKVREIYTKQFLKKSKHKG